MCGKHHIGVQFYLDLQVTSSPESTNSLSLSRDGGVSLPVRILASTVAPSVGMTICLKKLYIGIEINLKRDE